MTGIAILVLLIALLAQPIAAQPSLVFGAQWQVIGPFPRGMREIGSDPLECWGGILDIPIASAYTYPSEYATNGSVTWSSWPASIESSAEGTSSQLGPVTWPIWSDTFLAAPLGWSSLLWQGWAVTNVTVSTTSSWFVTCASTHAFYVDDSLFHGDYYGYGLLYQPITLVAGVHTLRVKLESSVRLFGFTPNVTISCAFYAPPEPASRLIIVPTSVPILPNVVAGERAGDWGSIAVANIGDGPLHSVTAFATGSCGALTSGVNIAPGQSIALGFGVTSNSEANVCVCALESRSECLLNVTFPLTQVAPGMAFAFTFLDYDGSVQYAMWLPPAIASAARTPVTIATHGAGVEASNRFWTSAFAPQAAPILFATGRRPWGFDWHGPSARNIWSALAAAASGAITPINSTQFDPTKILWTGHSMGGGGAWFLGTHYPDLAVGVAPAAGFISLQKYVPYYLNLGNSQADPYLHAVLSASVAAYESDTHASNLAGIPVIARYGSLDNNVPPWNSRRNARLIDEWSDDAAAVEVSEVPGQGHWFPDVMNGTDMVNFYTRCLANGLPAFPRSFVATCFDPSICGARGSLQMLQLVLPSRMGRITVNQVSAATWNLQAQNVLRFCITVDARSASLHLLTINGQALPARRCPETHYCMSSGRWATCAPVWPAYNRLPSQLGPAAKVLERPFAIVIGSSGNDSALTLLLQEQALLIANDWFLYSNGNVTIYDATELPASVANSFNLVLLGPPWANPAVGKLRSDIHFASSPPSVSIGSVVYTGSIGAAYLAPVGREGLALVLAGTDLATQEAALLAFPYRTGVEVPDWLVFGPQFNCEGVGGTLAAGWWGNDWSFNAAVSYTT